MGTCEFANLVEQRGPVNELGPDGRDVQFGGEQNCPLSGFCAPSSSSRLASG